MHNGSSPIGFTENVKTAVVAAFVVCWFNNLFASSSASIPIGSSATRSSYLNIEPAAKYIYL